MYHIRILPNQIVWETEKAYLIRLPRSRWKMWASKKICQRNQKSYLLLICDSMEIEVISDAGNKKKLTSDQLMSRFGFDMDYEIIGDLVDD